MMNFLPLCKAIIQHQRVNKGGFRFGIMQHSQDVYGSILLFNICRNIIKPEQILSGNGDVLFVEWNMTEVSILQNFSGRIVADSRKESNIGQGLQISYEKPEI